MTAQRQSRESEDAAWDEYFNYGGLLSIYAEGMDDEQKVFFLGYVTKTICDSTR